MTVHVHALTVTSAGRTLVDVTDVRLDRGRAVTIVGESGSGKSLLAHAVMGTLAPELVAQGRATVDGIGHDLSDRRARRGLWGRTLALLPQEPVLALSTLGFVGVGLQPPAAELGLMITEAFPYWSEAPWMSLAPVLVLTTVLVGLLGLRSGCSR